MLGLAATLLLVLILILGAFMSASGAARQYKDILITWCGGLFAIGLVALVGGLLAMWSSWLGLLFLVAGALYILDWMVKS